MLKDYTINGRLKQIPAKQKKLLVILHWLAGQFEPDRKYTEREVNEILTRYHPDYASLRRDLIDALTLDAEIGNVVEITLEAKTLDLCDVLATDVLEIIPLD